MAAVLVDSTIFIDWMRRGHSPVVRLAPHLSSGGVVTCGVVRAEVLRGVVHARVHAEIETLFDLMPVIDTTGSIWRAVADLAWKLDRRGRVLPVTDLVIAACARSIHAEVVSLDHHFGEIPGIRWHTRMQSPA